MQSVSDGLCCVSAYIDHHVGTSSVSEFLNALHGIFIIDIYSVICAKLAGDLHLGGVCCQAGNNDGARANLSAILKEITSRELPVLLAGMPAPANYGEAYMNGFNAIYPELSAEYGAQHYPNFMAGIGAAESLAEVASFLQSDGLHPNKAGVARIVDHIGPFVIELISQKVPTH